MEGPGDQAMEREEPDWARGNQRLPGSHHSWREAVGSPWLQCREVVVPCLRST